MRLSQKPKNNVLLNAFKFYSTQTNKKYFCTKLSNNFKKKIINKDIPMNFERKIEKITKNLEIVVPADGLLEKLKSSEETQKPLRIKLGFDPTAPDLHLGHAVVLKKLQDFQSLGHKVVVIIGDFTASIGDPTGKNKTRPPLSHEEIKTNAHTYLDQLSKIIDISKTEIHYNSKWLGDLKFNEMIQLVSKVTLSQILQRDDFNERQKNDQPIFFHELLYPIIQGYDSLIINADVEIGGTDQLFNCLVGRDLQSVYQKEKQAVACMPILKGLDGKKKMGKSLKNYIGLTELPENMYGKVMSIPDSLIEEYATLLCNFSLDQLDIIRKKLSDVSTNPMDVKKEVAFDIVTQFHGVDQAIKSADHFYKQVQSRDDDLVEFQPVSLETIEFDKITLLSFCTSLDPQKSKGQIRRLIEAGGVKVNSEKIIDPNVLIKSIIRDDFNLKMGKRGFFRVMVNKE